MGRRSTNAGPISPIVPSISLINPTIQAIMNCDFELTWLKNRHGGGMSFGKLIALIFVTLTFQLAATEKTATSDSVQIIPHYSMQEYDAEIKKIYANNPQHNQQSIETKVAIYSAAFLGKPSVHAALGEGPNAKFDKSPLYRMDVFDCNTYAATVLALAESKNLAEFKNNIVKINYKNQNATYENRNHFAEVDWDAKNQKNGYLRDVTLLIKDNAGKPVAKVANATIAKPAWFAMKKADSIKVFTPLSETETKRRVVALQAIKNKVKSEDVMVRYIPFTALFDAQKVPNAAVFDQIPSGSLIQIVRPNWDLTSTIGTHLNISHMGFAIRDERGLIFRDASALVDKVRDIPLHEYLKICMEKPTIKGINVQKVISPRI